MIAIVIAQIACPKPGEPISIPCIHGPLNQIIVSEVHVGRGKSLRLQWRRKELCGQGVEFGLAINDLSGRAVKMLSAYREIAAGIVDLNLAAALTSAWQLGFNQDMNTIAGRGDLSVAVEAIDNLPSIGSDYSVFGPAAVEINATEWVGGGKYEADSIATETRGRVADVPVGAPSLWLVAGGECPTPGRNRELCFPAIDFSDPPQYPLFVEQQLGRDERFDH